MESNPFKLILASKFHFLENYMKINIVELNEELSLEYQKGLPKHIEQRSCISVN